MDKPELSIFFINILEKEKGKKIKIDTKNETKSSLLNFGKLSSLKTAKTKFKKAEPVNKATKYTVRQ